VKDLIANSSSSTTIKALPLIGVSLNWFLNFLNTDSCILSIVRKKGENVATMDDILVVIEEMTAEKDDVSIGEMLRRIDSKLAKDVAEIFISYARKYLFVDMLRSLEALVAREGNIFIWFD
jgi:hypothetical protein